MDVALEPADLPEQAVDAMSGELAASGRLEAPPSPLEEADEDVDLLREALQGLHASPDPGRPDHACALRTSLRRQAQGK